MSDGESPEAKPATAVSKISAPLWWLREFVAASLWALALADLFVVDVGDILEARVPSLSTLIHYRLLVALGSAAVLWPVLGNRRFLRTFGYVLVYPVVLLVWTVPKILFRNWAVAIAFSPAIYQLLTTFRTSFVMAVAALISAFAVCLAPADPQYIVPGLVIVGAYLAFHYARRFRVAYSASTVFADLGSGLAKAWDTLRNAMVESRPEGDPNSEEYKQQQGQSLLQAYMFTAGLYFLGARFQEVVESRKLDLYFLGSLIWTFGLTAIGFAVLYFGLARLEPSSFSGVDAPGLLDFVGFSFSTLMTSSISPIKAVSGLAQVLTYVQLFGSLLIIVLLVFIILTSIRERYRQDLDGLVRELGQAADRAGDQIESNFEITMSAAERILLDYNEALMKTLLRIRYGEAIAAQIAERAREPSSEERHPQLESLAAQQGVEPDVE